MQIYIAVEGIVDEAVLRRLVGDLGPDLEVVACLGREGKDDLRAWASRLNTTAYAVPCVMLTDLDQCECPPRLAEVWVPRPHPNFLLRVAVREVEAWLLADRERVAQLLALPVSHLPSQPETLANPKAVLVQLASRSRRRAIRQDLVPREGSTARVGPNYNSRLAEFVRNRWQWSAATHRSDSLARAVNALQRFGG